MKLTKAQRKVYDYLKEQGTSTTLAIDNACHMTRSSMRISEINYAYKKEHGDDLIVNVGKNEHRQVLKALKTELTKKVQNVEIVDGVAVIRYETVSV